MKLVDILARELTAWPKTTRLAQDSDGHVFGWTGFPNWIGNQWLIGVGASLDKCRPGEMDLADDHMTSSVTRAEWQAAVEALNAPKVVEWDGVGRPPEGTVCGLWYKGCDQGECTVLFMGAEVGVFKSHAFDHEQHGDLVHYSFYKVENSTEEKEVQERKKVIAEMTTIAGGQYSPRDSIVQRLYDAGFRKQVAK